jgi:hypothetical protein
VSERIVQRGLPLAVLPIVDRLDLRCTTGHCRLQHTGCVGDFEHHLMRTVGGRLAPAGPNFGQYDLGSRLIRQTKLRPVAFADAHMLDEAEDLLVPRDGLPNIGDSEHRGDPSMRCRAVRQHGTMLDLQAILGNRSDLLGADQRRVMVLVLLVGRNEIKPHEDPIRAKRVDPLEAKISEQFLATHVRVVATPCALGQWPGLDR